jgi:glycosyltransferase involved in cell wall biosynthesis
VVHVAAHPASLRFFVGAFRDLASRGVDVHAVASPGPDLDHVAGGEQVPVHGVPISRFMTPLRDLVSIVALWRCLRRIRPDVVVAHMSKGGLIGMIAAWLARVPGRVYYNHGLALDSARGTKAVLLRIAETISHRLARRVFCVSHSVRDLILAYGLCPARKVQVLANGSVNGVDAARRFDPGRAAPERAATRRRFGIPEDALVVGFVGRVFREKGIVELVAAWKEVAAAVPGAWLVVAGPTDEKEPIPADVLEALHTHPRIRLLGFVEDTPALYAAIDVLVLPSEREGLPVVTLEAAAMALPIVATRVVGCVDAVVDGETGTLVPARDPGALARAVRAYLQDPVLRRRHGEAGRARVRRDFRPEDIWDATFREYVALAAEVAS